MTARNGAAPEEQCPYCSGTGKVKASAASRFRMLREKHNLTQAEMANVAGISRTQWTNLEAGRSEPSLALLMRLADAYQLRVDWLLGRP